MKRRKDPYRETTGRRRLLTWVLRLGLLLVVVTGCMTAVFILYNQWVEGRQPGVVVEGGNPNLSSAERLYLQTYLAARAEELQSPAGEGFTPIPFIIASGETADSITTRLATEGIVMDAELFANYLRFYGLDSQLEAGEFILDPQQTIPDLAATLTQAVAREETVRFVEGWRLEQMADHLRENPVAQVDAAVFRDIAQRRAAFDLTPYDFLADLPPGATLEGYLFPDTYRLPLDADAVYLVDLMLQTFGRRVTPAMQQGFQAQGLTLHEAVTLASIVEREAVVPGERPLIAGVFYNRLAQGIKLEADPTVQYPLGYQADRDSWWKSPLSQADLELDSPYNTYVYGGLPPGPIANPSLSSLEGVAFPQASDFIFFVADCTAAVPGSHAFSQTYEEHLATVNRCR